MHKLIVLLCALAAANAAFDLDKGVRISGRVAIKCLATDFGLKCSTCSTAVLCNGDVKELGTLTCESPNNFCDPKTNSCGNVKPAECEATSADFNCPEEGFFPDPKNCQNYFWCTAAKATAELWQCPVNYVYDALKGSCKKKFHAADCVTLKCTAENTKTSPFLVHAGNPNFYAFCDVATMTATLFKCPKNQQFSSGCKFVCKAEGYFAGSNNGQAYHCAKSGLNWVQSIFNCPTGYEYDAKWNCVKVVV